MKMSSQMVERALSQLEAEAVPENHPAVTQLNRLFGDHTYFIDHRTVHRRADRAE